jgi:hypothetical protein
MHARRAAALAVISVLAIPALLHAEQLGAGSTPGAEELAMTTSRTAARTRLEPATPRDGQLTEQDVRAWLDDYRRAWEARDVGALSALGVIRAEQQETLRRVLAKYQEFRVSVGIASIAFDQGHALVSFDRIDTDETGAELRHPRQSLQLERLQSGVVATAHATLH